MKIETKYNVGDLLYTYLISSRNQDASIEIRCVVVESIYVDANNICYNCRVVTPSYNRHTLESGLVLTVYEDKLFKTLHSMFESETITRFLDDRAEDVKYNEKGN